MDRLTWTVLVEQAPRTIIRHELPQEIAPDGYTCLTHLSCIAGRCGRLSQRTSDTIINSAEVYHALPAAGETCRWCRRPFNARPHHAFLPQPKVGRLSRQVGAGAFHGRNTGNWVEKNLARAMKNPWRWGTSTLQHWGGGPCVQNLPRVVGKPPELGMGFKTSNWRK